MKRIHYDEYDLGYVVDGFLAAALWTLPEDDDGNVAGDELSIFDFTDQAREMATHYCDLFMNNAQYAIKKFIDTWTNYYPSYSGGTPREHKMQKIGHDLWLTTNGHGAGFWDGDYPAPYGDELDGMAGDEEWYVDIIGDELHFE